jgi:hypothetical protein
MRFEVPQFIEIEDKIFGPLTWRQFLYVGGGVGLGVVLFIVDTPLIIFILFGLPLMVISGALAFYPVNNRPFSFFLEALINYVRGQKLYLWKKKEDIIHKNMFAPTEIPKDTLPRQPIKKQNVTTLARRLELQALQKNE